jgi:hypothetical protein
MQVAVTARAVVGLAVGVPGGCTPPILGPSGPLKQRKQSAWLVVPSRTGHIGSRRAWLRRPSTRRGARVICEAPPGGTPKPPPTVDTDADLLVGSSGGSADHHSPPAGGGAHRGGAELLAEHHGCVGVLLLELSAGNGLCMKELKGRGAGFKVRGFVVPAAAGKVSEDVWVKTRLPGIGHKMVINATLVVELRCWRRPESSAAGDGAAVAPLAATDHAPGAAGVRLTSNVDSLVAAKALPPPHTGRSRSIYTNRSEQHRKSNRPKLDRG